MALRTLKPRLQVLRPTAARPISETARIRGRKLQDRRLRMWSNNPHCASCGRLTQYPDGFELDHITPLFMGGQDVEENCQVLCSWIDEYGQRQGCHVAKSNEER